MTRDEKNAERLLLIDPSIRQAVHEVLNGMSRDGHLPVIAADVWRDPARQLELYNQGKSELKWGFHCACLPDGSPGSLAADIIDYERGWNVPLYWWAHIGYHAWQNNLGWGGYFGLTEEMRASLAQSIQKQNFEAVTKIGWDGAHCEVSGLSVSDARKGIRLVK